MKILRLLCLIALLALPLGAQTAHKVTLKWAASPTAAVTHYAVYRSTTHLGPYTYIGYTTGLSYVNGKNPDGSPLVEGQTYYYVIVAYTDVKGQFSVNSNEASATIPVTVTVLPAQNVTAESQ
jgi:hypothetical protein